MKRPFGAQCAERLGLLLDMPQMEMLSMLARIDFETCATRVESELGLLSSSIHLLGEAVSFFSPFLFEGSVLFGVEIDRHMYSVSGVQS